MKYNVGDTVYTVHYDQDEKLHLYETIIREIDEYDRYECRTKYGINCYSEDWLYSTPWQAIFYRRREIEKKIAEQQRGLEYIDRLEIEHV